MALNEAQATGVAKDLLVAMAQSGSLKTLGPYTGVSPDEDRNTRKGSLDAAYLASLYRDLVSGLQK